MDETTSRADFDGSARLPLSKFRSAIEERSLLFRDQPGWIFEPQIMAVVGRDDDERIFPIAVLFDPIGDGPEGLIAGIHCSD